MQLAELEAMLERDPVEDVALVYRSSGGDDDGARSECETALYRRIVQNREWKDPRKGADALLFARDIAFGHGLADGGTETYLTIRALELVPDDDEILLAYVRAVADGDYRYTDRSLADVARQTDDARWARWLATLNTLSEFLVLRAYLGDDGIYDGALRESFEEATELGMTRQDWVDGHAWLSENIGFVEVPEDLYDQFGPGS